MGYLTGSNITYTTGSNFIISESNGNFYFSNKTQSYNDAEYVYEMCSKLTGSYNSALVGGLGIGVIPQWLAKEKNCSVDILEKDSELINTVDNFNYLTGSINIIQADIFTHTPTGSYDIIVLDVWWNESDITDQIKTQLNSRYSGSGTVVYPLNKS